ncbi:MAG: hypothetical protein HKL98_00990 [Burkholderiales bacterium]|nr:hypothetical protein [Burkholderiales bacterium]
MDNPENPSTPKFDNVAPHPYKEFIDQEVMRRGGSGEPPMEYDGRISRLERDVAVLKGDVSVLRSDVSEIKASVPFLATKTEASEMKASLIQWIIGTAIALGATAITVMAFVLNNATPKVAAPQQPIIINVPGVGGTAASFPSHKQ